MGGIIFIAIVSLLESSTGDGSTSKELPARQLKIEKLEKIRRLRSKIENGLSPCFSQSCQQQKRTALQKISQAIQQLPISVDQSGILSAHKLLMRPFTSQDEMNQSSFPETITDWKKHWQLRRQYEVKMRSQWISFQGFVYKIREGTDFLFSVQGNHAQRNQFIELWKGGIGRAASIMLKQASLYQQVSTLEQNASDKTAANRLRTEIDNLSQELSSIEDQLGGKIRPVLSRYFPDRPFYQIVQQLGFLMSWVSEFHALHPLEADFVNHVEYFRKSINEATEASQLFSDLEYGMVGIRNFYSMTNPAVANETEIPVQEFLNQVEAHARWLVDLSASYLLYGAGISFGKTGGIILSSVFPVLSSLHKYTSIADLSMPPSTFSATLERQQPELDDQMENRIQELFRVKQSLIAKENQLKIGGVP
jgi:hypothetical protein